jgi:hypothetical protein
MSQAESAPIYKVCAVSEDRWDVLRGASPEPVATFNDKHAALAYAMSLARKGSPAWQPTVGRTGDALRNMIRMSARRTRGGPDRSRAQPR